MSGSQVKGTVMQTGKVLIIDRLRVSKYSILKILQSNYL